MLNLHNCFYLFLIVSNIRIKLNFSPLCENCGNIRTHNRGTNKYTPVTVFTKILNHIKLKISFQRLHFRLQSITKQEHSECALLKQEIIDLKADFIWVK